MNKTERDVFTKAIRYFTDKEQIRIAQEECAELIVAISKYHRVLSAGKNDRRYLERALKNVKEEMADVQIMLDQLQIIFDFTKKELNEIRKYKVERLMNMLPEEEE